jgi:serine/threonine protein kinase
MRVLKNLNHPSIIKMHDCIDKTNHMYIMME